MKSFGSDTMAVFRVNMAEHWDPSLFAVTMSYNVIIRPDMRTWYCFLLLSVNYIIYTKLNHRKSLPREQVFLTPLSSQEKA